MKKYILLGALLAAASGAGAAGDWDRLGSLTRSDRIRVVDLENRQIKGTFVQWSAEGLAVQTARQTVQISRAQVRKVRVRRKRSRAKGALIGGALGFGGGVGIGAYVTGQVVDKNNPGIGERVGVGALVGAIYGGIGAGIGALVSGPHEVTMYTKPERE